MLQADVPLSLSQVNVCMYCFFDSDKEKGASAKKKINFISFKVKINDSTLNREAVFQFQTKHYKDKAW